MEEREFVAGESRRSFVPRTALESPGAQIRVGNHDIHRLRIGPDIALSFSQRWSALHVHLRKYSGTGSQSLGPRPSSIERFQTLDCLPLILIRSISCCLSAEALELTQFY